MWTMQEILVMGNIQPNLKAHVYNLHRIWAKTELWTSVMQIVTKHQQHCYKKDPSKKLWTHGHFVLPHDIHNAMDMYVSLEYKHHPNVATNIKFWVDANFSKMLFFQQEAIGSKSIGLEFFIEIQIVSHINIMVDLGHQRVVACDVTFGINYNKIL